MNMSVAHYKIENVGWGYGKLSGQLSIDVHDKKNFMDFLRLKLNKMRLHRA